MQFTTKNNLRSLHGEIKVDDKAANLVCSMWPFRCTISMLKPQIMLPCTVSVSFLNHITNRSEINKDETIWFNKLCNTNLTEGWQTIPLKIISSRSFYSGLPENGQQQHLHLEDTQVGPVKETQTSTEQMTTSSCN